ncbi:S-adenosyl-L-methionine-dependent methyltransferase [Halteromyces radiatus]|uniref:S-adenosyl-L-methionine-dependent methyltransferase n=1 Tax=Halteromyces radiatus TaxID=101107 RepID=UPI00221FB70B|nr:S-adenosyl-L-methionine-dependent methyltransferase [Halteromyces radiatus]KAI8096470.1 S-adenosyl-L-methionine-dependent methyltransferase [Halteromyces radiatus]
MGTKHSKSIASQDTNRSRERSLHVQSSPSIILDGRIYHDIGSSAYCLPRDELEQDRLNSQHFSLKVIFNGNVLPIIATSLAQEAKILDIGCGSSTWCLEMALDYPRSQIRGLDMADMFPTTIRPQNVTFDLHNALEGLPYENNSFDLIHMRLLITAWRVEEWSFILKEIYRVLKPGGYVQLVESDFTVTQKSPMVEMFNKTLYTTIQQRGLDPFIVKHLDTLLPEHGFQIVEKELKLVNYGEKGNPISQEMLWNWKSAMKAMKPILAHHLLRQPEEYERFIDRYIQECEQFGLFLQIGAFAARKSV